MSDNNERKWTFYLAASYTKRADMRAESKRIERETGWQCTSRWLDGTHDKKAQVECAREDIMDLNSADIVVLNMMHKSSLGGMWVELGVALATGKHVVVFLPSKREPYMSHPVIDGPITPFLRMDGIVLTYTVSELTAYMKGLAHARRPPHHPMETSAGAALGR